MRNRASASIGRTLFYITIGVVLAIMAGCVTDKNDDTASAIVVIKDQKTGAEYTTSEHKLVYKSGADISCGADHNGLAPCEAEVPGPSYETNAFVQGSYCNSKPNGKCELKTNPNACTQGVVGGKLQLTCTAGTVCVQDADCTNKPTGTTAKCVLVGSIGVCAYFGGECNNESTGACFAKGIKYLDPSGKEICSASDPTPIGGEICGDGIDNDCNGQTDEEGAKGCTNYWTDSDSDSFGVTPSKCLCAPDKNNALTATKSGDCDDSKSQINPGAAEKCDGKDNDCNGQTDEAFDVKGAACDGADSDLCKNGTFTCKADGSGVECVNENPNGLTEICDDVDNDCDGETDEGCDDDKDGYCDKGMAVMGVPKICPKGVGDCDDSKSQINPGAVEKCNAIDDNCDGATDESFKLGEVCSKGVGQCQAAGFTICAADGSATCNAADFKADKEACDDKDNDCDGVVDNGCDDDGDGWCDNNLQVIGVPKICPKGSGDCDDTQKSVHNEATEICDGLDNNCDGATDEGLDVPVSCGKGVCKVTVTACVGGKPQVCAPDMTKQTTEICDDLDNNCDGQVNENSVCEPSKAPKKLGCGETVKFDTATDKNAKNVFGSWFLPNTSGALSTPSKEEMFDLSSIPLGKKFMFKCSVDSTSPGQMIVFILLKGVSAVPDTDTNNDGQTDAGSKAMVSIAGLVSSVEGIGGLNVWAAVDGIFSSQDISGSCTAECF